MYVSPPTCGTASHTPLPVVIPYHAAWGTLGRDILVQRGMHGSSSSSESSASPPRPLATAPFVRRRRTLAEVCSPRRSLSHVHCGPPADRRGGQAHTLARSFVSCLSSLVSSPPSELLCRVQTSNEKLSVLSPSRHALFLDNIGQGSCHLRLGTYGPRMPDPMSSWPAQPAKTPAGSIAGATQGPVQGPRSRGASEELKALQSGSPVISQLTATICGLTSAELLVHWGARRDSLIRTCLLNVLPLRVGTVTRLPGP